MIFNKISELNIEYKNRKLLRIHMLIFSEGMVEISQDVDEHVAIKVGQYEVEIIKYQISL